MPDGLLEALEEDRPQQGDQGQGDGDLVAVEEARGEGVLDDVGGGVGGRQGDGDDEVGGDEPEQGEDEELALPPGEQVLEHGDGALAVRALPGHAAVDRQGPEEGQQDEDQRGDGRQGPGGQRGDAGLVAEGREVIDAGQAHDLPPRVLVVRAALAGRPLDPLGVPLQQPEKERPRRALNGRLGIEGLCHDSSPLNSSRRCSRIPAVCLRRRERPRGLGPAAGRRRADPAAGLHRQAGGERVCRATDADHPRKRKSTRPSTATSPMRTAGWAGPGRRLQPEADPFVAGVSGTGRVRAAMAPGAESHGLTMNGGEATAYAVLPLGRAGLPWGTLGWNDWNLSSRPRRATRRSD